MRKRIYATAADRQRAYREADRDKHNTIRREWHSENLEKSRKIKRDWYHANKHDPAFAERLRQWDRARKVKRRAAGPGYTVEDVDAKKLAQNGKCAVCRAVLADFHVDHIIPIKLGGQNIPSNIQLLCPPCNLSKGAKDPIAFMQSRGCLL